MKRIIALVLSIMILAAFTACSDKNDKISTSDGELLNGEEVLPDADITSDADIDAETENDSGDIADDNNTGDKKEENKPAESKPSEDKAQTKPEESKPTESKPSEDKTQTKPEESKPADTPAAKPEATAKTIGTALLADFNSKAASYSDAKALAEAISQNSVIEFMPVVESVSAGLLTGFGNAQIAGFKGGAKFAPMIGTIPFVGYVFVLEDGASAASFIAELRANANPNWNVCTTADETVTGSVGNKVFFVMSPKNFEE